MIYLFIVVHVIVCLFLIAVILLQQGKSADLAGAFGGQGSQTAFGPRSAANLLTRITTWCAIVFMMTSLTLSFKRSSGQASTGSILEQTSQPAAAPAKPAATPPIQIPVQPSSQTPAPAPNPAPKN